MEGMGCTPLEGRRKRRPSNYQLIGGMVWLKIKIWNLLLRMR